MKQLTLWCFRHTFGEVRLKLMQWRCICARSSKLTSSGRPKNITLWTSFWDVLRTSTVWLSKTDVLGTSQVPNPMEGFLGRIEDVHRTVLQNCKNMQQLTFQYFTQHIWWSKIENNTTVTCFLIDFQIGVLWTSRGHHFRTLLGPS